MLNDPAVVTIDGSAKSLARITSKVTSDGASDGSIYRDSTGEYSLEIKEYVLQADPFTTGRSPRRVDVSLRQKNLADVHKSDVAVGMHFIFDENATPDYSKLQPALIAFLTDALRARLVTGEN
jgi:hypothetical protein